MYDVHMLNVSDMQITRRKVSGSEANQLSGSYELVGARAGKL